MRAALEVYQLPFKSVYEECGKLNCALAAFQSQVFIRSLCLTILVFCIMCTLYSKTQSLGETKTLIFLTILGNKHINASKHLPS
jgi:hypothetical protein